jgi:hypothetical protein
MFLRNKQRPLRCGFQRFLVSRRRRRSISPEKFAECDKFGSATSDLESVHHLNNSGLLKSLIRDESPELLRLRKIPDCLPSCLNSLASVDTLLICPHEDISSAGSLCPCIVPGIVHAPRIKTECHCGTDGANASEILPAGCESTTQNCGRGLAGQRRRSS